MFMVGLKEKQTTIRKVIVLCKADTFLEINQNSFMVHGAILSPWNILYLAIQSESTVHLYVLTHSENAKQV